MCQAAIGMHAKPPRALHKLSPLLFARSTVNTALILKNNGPARNQCLPFPERVRLDLKTRRLNLEMARLDMQQLKSHSDVRGAISVLDWIGGEGGVDVIFGEEGMRAKEEMPGACMLDSELILRLFI